MTDLLRVALVTGMEAGAAGSVLEAIARLPNINVQCVIVSRGVQNRRNVWRKRFKKIGEIGILGAIIGLRIRRFYVHSVTSNVRTVAHRLGIEVIDVDSVNSLACIASLQKYGVDLGISVSNGYISPNTFQVPRDGFINYHGELLPDYPGALSIVWPIFFGRTKTGYTIHKIDRGIDRGAILLRREFDIAFRPTLRETVEATGLIVHPHVPAAISTVLEKWDKMNGAAQENQVTRKFTTPTFWQYLRMCRNNRHLFLASLPDPHMPNSATHRQ